MLVIKMISNRLVILRESKSYSSWYL